MIRDVNFFFRGRVGSGGKGWGWHSVMSQRLSGTIWQGPISGENRCSICCGCCSICLLMSSVVGGTHVYHVARLSRQHLHLTLWPRRDGGSRRDRCFVRRGDGAVGGADSQAARKYRRGQLTQHAWQRPLWEPGSQTVSIAQCQDDEAVFCFCFVFLFIQSRSWFQE